MNILNQGFDHVEYGVAQIDQTLKLFDRMGFEKVGERVSTAKGTRTVAVAQGQIRVLLTESLSGGAPAKDPVIQFHKKHGDGISVLAIEVDDARKAYTECIQKGAKSALEPQVYESAQGRVVRAEIFTPSDLRYALIERHASSDWSKPALLDEGLVIDRLESPSPMGLYAIDHLTNNVSIGQMGIWVEWYKKIFGFIVSRHFDIRTGRTGLISDVVQSPDGKIKVPINEATEPESQVQEFVNRFDGPGVQHLALLTTDIQHTVRSLQKQAFKFLTVPSTYYEVVPTRVPGVTENLKTIEELSILLDGSKDGYLLQIFTEELMGPFFCEFIQRKGDKGFGEGNFRALFEAIERDQIRRGVLKG